MTPWFPLHPECRGRDLELAAVLHILGAARVVAISGAPGIGKTHLASTVAYRLGGTGTVVSLAGCSSRADVVRAVGDALGVFPCGDEAAVRAGLGPGWLLADDVTPETAEALLGLDLQGELLLVGDVGEEVQSVELGPLGADVIGSFAPGVPTGNPLHAMLAMALQCPVEDLRERLKGGRALSGLPMGLGIRVDLTGKGEPASLERTGGGAARPPQGSLPALALRPDPRDRRVLRAGVVALLGGTEREGADWVREVLRARPARLEALRASAYGAPTEGTPDPRDILLLRLLARRLPVESADRLAVLSAAVGARLALRCGQVAEARAMVRLLKPTAPFDAGLLRWVDGDALLALGDLPSAQNAWSEAEEHLLRARLEERAQGRRDGAGAVELLLSTAEQLGLRGYQSAAAGLVCRARALARDAGDAAGLCASWGASAGIATALGEGVSAMQFVAESGGPVRGAEIVGVALAAQAGRVTDGLRVLEGLRSDEPLARANIVRRRADLLLRDGAHARAARASQEAAALYASIGEHVSSAQSLRVAADALALSGDLQQAASLYIAVIALQVRVQDLAGLERSLLRAAMVDEARGAMDAASLRREQREAVKRAR